MICLEDFDNSELYYLVQGIEETEIARGQNLYLSAVYSLLSYADSKKYKRVYLGRGNHEKKLLMGANRFHLLDHWLLSLTEVGRLEFDEIARRSVEMFRILDDPKSPFRT